MGLITKSIPGFYNGVSQQPPSLRLETQLDAQVNMVCSLVDGVYKRPGTQFIANAQAPDHTFNTALHCVHTISRDDTEHYFVLITDDAESPIAIYTLQGAKCEIRYGTLDASLEFTSDDTVKSYLTSGVSKRKAAKRFGICTVADYTFITNNTVIPRWDAATVEGSLVKTVQTFNELPTLHGDEKYGTPVVDGIYKVQGDEKKHYIGYYLKYHSDKVYRETIKPGSKYRFDSSTMPHRLVRTGVNQFTFAPCLWDDMAVGDNTVCVPPSFIGQPIKNVFYYKTRLGFLTAQSAVFSRFSSFFNLFPETALQVLDTDPIDISTGSTNKVCDLINVATMASSLILFSKNEQFMLTTDDQPLTPETATLTATTAYEVPDVFSPILMGNNVYFPTPKSNYISMMEYFVNEDTLATEAADVTAHCPNYIPNGTLLMTSCLVADTLFIKSSKDPHSIYTYKYYWNGDEKVQSAWGKWSFEDEPIAIINIESSLYFLFRTEGGQWYTAFMELDDSSSDISNSKVLLDKRTIIEGVYDTENEYTVYSSPYSLGEKSTLVNSLNRMEIAEAEYTGNEWRIPGDVSSIPMVLGNSYTAFFTLSKFYLKTGEGSSITDAKYQIRSLVLAFTNTGMFNVEVISEGYPRPLVHTYSGVPIGAAVLDQVSLVSSEKRFMVMANNQKVKITIQCPSYLPAAFQSGSMEVFFHSRGQIR